MSGLSTDAFAFLNINHPLTSWATYRGSLVSAPTEPGFVSVWSAGMMRADDPARLSRELALESFRQAHYSGKISRLRGMFCFLDIASAERACSWSGSPRSHFRPEYLAELHLGEAGPRRDRFDANWIPRAPVDNNGNMTEFEWIHRYWNGEAYPDDEPIWETLIDGRAVVLGTSLRERAYARIKSRFPDSLLLLEVARQAAWVGSDLGNVCGYLRNDGAELVLDYVMDMRDANDEGFLDKLKKLKLSGHPINWADITPHIKQETLGKTMDLRPFGFRRPKIAMPYVSKKPSAA